MGGCGGGRDFASDVGAAAEAGVNETAVAEDVERCAVFIEVFGLDSDLVIPVEPKPGEIFYDGLRELGAAAGWVYIFKAEEEFTTSRAGAAPGNQRGMCVAEVEQAGRAGGEAGDDGHRLRIALMGMEGRYGGTRWAAVGA